MSDKPQVIMSRDVRATVSFHQRKLSWVDLLRTLLLAGWSIANSRGGVICYEPDEDDDLSPVELPDRDETKVLERLESLESAQRPFGLSLTWRGTDAGVIAYFSPRRESATFSLCEGEVFLPRLEPFIDTSWYTSRIVRPAVEAGFQIESLEWTESS